MKPPRPQFELIKVPKLHPDIKAMNGKSTRQVVEKLDDLTNLLDEKDEKAADSDPATK